MNAQLDAPAQLAQVTVCCVDTRFPDLAIDALRKTSEKLSFAKTIFFTDKAIDAGNLPNVSVIQIDRIRSKEDYSHFIVKKLIDYIETDFVLIVQWDGFVIHPDSWDAGFLDYDYIGAVWPNREQRLSVGNGGFSLRSMKLLKALSDERVTDIRNEDADICIRYRDFLEKEHGIRFAPVEVAQRFSFERQYLPNTFGFHGFFNFHRVMQADELERFIKQRMPEELFGSREALELAVGLAQGGNPLLAQAIIARRLKLKPQDINTRVVADRLCRAREACMCGSGRPYAACCGRRSIMLGLKVLLRGCLVRLGWASLK